ncbi:helix-turn-helix domain-containing protein [Mycobacterium sp. Y57]|nr:helix-turn-helix domain-containing protein [Mycolicibacterium xanthum]
MPPTRAGTGRRSPSPKALGVSQSAIRNDIAALRDCGDLVPSTKSPSKRPDRSKTSKRGRPSAACPGSPCSCSLGWRSG